MTKRTVLAIGIDPAFADFTAFPELTPELIRNYIAVQIDQLRARGYDATSCLIDLGQTAEQVLTAVLKSRTFDCIMIGAGLRQPAPQMLLFEKVINLVHALAPDARLCFKSSPADTAEAVERWVQP